LSEDGQRGFHQRSAFIGSFPAKRALLPRMLFRALRPGVIFASLASDLEVIFITAKRSLRPGVILANLAAPDAPRRLASDLEVVFHPREAGLASPDASPGIATWHDPRQP